MENKKQSSSFDLGPKGWIIIALGFVSIYFYSALMNDSLNIMIPAFAEKIGMNQTVLYSFSTIATIVGVLASVLWGKLMKEKTDKLTWVVSLVLVAVFAVVWANANNYVVYALGYLVCYAGCMGCGTIANGTVISNWYPRKRGLAMGFITAGFPLSAATASSLCNSLVSSLGVSAFYYFIAICDIVLALIVLAYVKDYPEEKGAFPDNDKLFDKAQARRELEAGIAYMKTSKWQIRRLLVSPRLWHLVFAMGILGFLSMGIMTNFVKKNLEFGYAMPEILKMLAIAGILAVPGSIFIGWLDVKIGTRKSCVLTYLLGILAITFNLTRINSLHYVALPLLALMLGARPILDILYKCHLGAL